MPASPCSPPMTSITAEPSALSNDANVLFAWLGPNTRNDSFMESPNPTLFPQRSGSTHRPRLLRRSLLSKCAPPLSHCR